MHELGVTVNCLIPGHIGGIKSLASQNEEASRNVESILQKGGLGEVSDIVKVASFLVSDSAKFVTGQVVSVDGGCL